MHELFWISNSAEQRIWGICPHTLHRRLCVLLMSDAIRYSSSLLNSLWIYYTGPWRFPFQMLIDFIFKSALDDCFNSGCNSAALLCPWKLKLWRVRNRHGSLNYHMKSSRKYKQFCSMPGDQRLCWQIYLVSTSLQPNPGVEGRHESLLMRAAGDPLLHDTKLLSLILSQHWKEIDLMSHARVGILQFTKFH